VPALLFAADAPPARIDRMITPFRAVLSPCVGICTMGDDGLCNGCLRTIDEIARWGAMGDGERLRLMDDVLPRREASRADG
jgi:predicted Fe-S protein YdhL (DUF1289 family)